MVKAKWKAEEQFVPPHGTFKAGDDVSHLPAETLASLKAQGKITTESLGAAKKSSGEVAPSKSKE